MLSESPALPQSTLDALAARKPRENSGSDTFRAYDFQINVSIARILSLHRAGEEYTAFFDHHDDLVVLSGNGDMEELSFYQVKSSKKLTWTPSRLAKRENEGELPRSIIGKAFFNVTHFGQHVRRAAILSNRPLSATLAASTKPALHDGELSLADLCSADVGVLTDALMLDFPGAFDASRTAVLTFERVPLDLDSFRTTLVGALVDFLEDIHTDFAGCAMPLYQSLLTAVGECTGNRTRSTTVAELKLRKGLAKADVTAALLRVRSRLKTVTEWWPTVEAELSSAGKGALAIQRIRTRCLAYWAARRAGESVATELSAEIGVALAKTPLASMDSVLDAALALEQHGISEPSSPLYDLRSALIVESMEAVL